MLRSFLLLYGISYLSSSKTEVSKFFTLSWHWQKLKWLIRNHQTVNFRTFSVESHLKNTVNKLKYSNTKRIICELHFKSRNLICVATVLSHNFHPPNLNLPKYSFSTTLPNKIFTNICYWKELLLLFWSLIISMWHLVSY